MLSAKTSFTRKKNRPKTKICMLRTQYPAKEKHCNSNEACCAQTIANGVSPHYKEQVQVKVTVANIKQPEQNNAKSNH